MADLVLHLAVAVLVASLFRLEAVTKYVVVAVTLVPALAPLTVGLVEPFMAAVAPDATVSTVHAVAWLFTPGGGMESLLVAVAVGLIGLLATIRPRARTWRPRIGLALGAGWAAYVFVELIVPGTVHPFWPFSTMGVDFALVSHGAPLILILSVFYLAGEGMADMWRWDKARADAAAAARGVPIDETAEDAEHLFEDHDEDHRMGARTRLVLRKFGPRLAKGAYRFAGVVLVFMAVVKVAGAAGAPVTLDGMAPDSFPLWTQVTSGPDGTAYHVAEKEPFSAPGAGRDVPVVPAGLSETQQERAATALCLTGRMGPVMDLHHPVVVAVEAGRVLVAEAHRVVDGALTSGAGWLVVFTADGVPQVGPSVDGREVAWRAPSVFVTMGGCVA